MEFCRVAQQHQVAGIGRQILQHAGDRHHQAIGGAAKAEDELLPLGRHERIAVKIDMRRERLTAEARRLAGGEIPE